MKFAYDLSAAAAAVLGLIVAGLTVWTIVTMPVAQWTSISSIGFLAIMLGGIFSVARNRMNVFATIAALFGALVIGRLFSTMRLEGDGDVPLEALDPLLIAETGPGFPSITYTATALVITLALHFLLITSRNRSGASGTFLQCQVSTAEWGMTALRVYVGLMFIAHFAAHIFGGPIPFSVFVDYFGSIGLPFPSAFVVLAGLIELAVCIGLAFGFMTRIAAVGATVYLFVSVGLGGHYSVGYVWVLPTGGWEFPALWMFATALFAFVGGGTVSLDHWLRPRFAEALGHFRFLIA